MMNLLKTILFCISFTFLFVRCSDSTNKNDSDQSLWVGEWKMTGYDSASVTDSNIVQFMKLDAGNTIEFITQTKKGEILLQNTGEYKINDQQSVLSIIEDGKVKVEYFIRKLDKDSLIFQDGKFKIKWIRVH